MSTVPTAAARALKERQKNRNLPTVEIPAVGEDELARTLQGIQEHLRMYEGDSGAPKERFVTIAELENAGLIKSDVKSRFAYISQVLETDVAQLAGSTANPTIKNSVPKDTSRTSRTPGGGSAKTQAAVATTARFSAAQDVDAANPAKNDFVYYDGNKFTTIALLTKSNTWAGRQLFKQPLEMTERATGPVALAGLGYIWTKAGTPNTLWFTDDAGTEVQLGAAAAAVGVGDINAEASTDGWVITSDGAGNAAWEAVPSGGAEVNDLTAAVTWANIPIANVPTGTSGSTVSLGNHTHAGVYEPVDATIVRTGDAAWNATDWDTAFGWGDHASGGYAAASTVVRQHLSDTWLFDNDVTASAPETNSFKFNSATLGSITSWRIDDTGGLFSFDDMEQWFPSFSTIRIYSQANVTEFWDFYTTGVTSDQTGHWTQTIKYIGGSSTLPVNDATYMIRASTQGRMPILGTASGNVGDVAVWDPTVGWEATSRLRVNHGATNTDGSISITAGNFSNPNNGGLVILSGGATSNAWFINGATPGLGYFAGINSGTFELGYYNGSSLPAFTINSSNSLVFPSTAQWYLQERAAAAGSAPAHGQVWLKSDIPNTLWFTNDAGTDFQLGLIGNQTYSSDFIWSTGATSTVQTGSTFKFNDNVGLFFGTGSDVSIAFDGTDMVIDSVLGTTDLNITDFAAINAGTVDVDFAAITATSYGGITEANLVDKTATETVSGAWTFSAATTLLNGTIIANSSGTAQIYFYDEGNTNKWRIGCTGAAGDDWILYSSDRAKTVISINETTDAISFFDDLSITGALTATSYGGITEANLLDLSDSEVVTGAWSIPSLVNTQNGNYTLVLGDAGKTIHKVSGGAG